LFFDVFSFLLVDIEDMIVLQKTNPKNLLLYFLGGWKCQQGVGTWCGQGQFFDLDLNLHIWGNNGWILACSFFMDRYFSQKCIAKKNAKNLHQFSLADGGVDGDPGICADAGNFFLNL
jgi:hypothetical protein